MKRTLIFQMLVLACCCLTLNVAAQNCSPDPVYATESAGMYPNPPQSESDPAIPGAVTIGDYYEYSFTINALNDFVAGPTITPVQINSISVANISGLPAGLSYACEPVSCTVPDGQIGCVRIFGYPDASNSPGVYDLTVDLNFEILPGIPIIYTIPDTTAGSNYHLPYQIILEENPVTCADLNIIGSPYICEGESASLTVTDGFLSYQWSNGDITDAITINSPGDYSVTAIDSNGDTCAATYTVLEQPNPTPTISGSMEYCAGYSTTLYADAGLSGDVLYEWNTGQIGQIIDVNIEGYYEVTVTSEYGCTGVVGMDVYEMPEPAFDITYVIDGSSIILEGPIGFAAYDWSTAETTQNIIVSSTVDTSYCLTVYTDQGCAGTDCIAIPYDIIQDTCSIPLELNDTYLTFCDGDGPVTTSAIPDTYASYQWSHGQTGPTATFETFGTFSVTATDSEGCEAYAEVIVDILPIETSSIIYQGCVGDGYSVDVGGTIYDESNPSGVHTLVSANGCDSIVVIDLVFSSSITGTESYSGCTGDGYWVEVNGMVYDEGTPTGTEILMSSYGCDSVVTINLVFDDISVEIDGPTDMCLGGMVTLSANITPAPTGGETYYWSTGETTPTIVVNSPGAYTVYAASGSSSTCVALDTIFIEDVVGVVNIDASDVVWDLGDVIDLSVSGMYDSYEWSTGETSSAIQVESPGTYYVTVTQGGCQGVGMTVIESGITCIAEFSLIDWGSNTYEFVIDSLAGAEPLDYYFEVWGEAIIPGTGGPYIYEFTEDGVYDICLNLTDATGSVCAISCESVYIGDVCLDWDVIDLSEAPCTWDYDPVCGCDGYEYVNECIAYYCFGVVDWTPGPCTGGVECTDLDASFYYYAEPNDIGGYDIHFSAADWGADTYNWDLGLGFTFGGMDLTIQVPELDSVFSLTACLIVGSAIDSCTETVCETIVLDDTPNAIIEGYVFDGDGLWEGNPMVERTMATGTTPLEGILVELQDVRGNVIKTTTTDAEGKYSFPELQFGDYFVHVNIEGVEHVPYQVSLDPTFQQEKDLSFEVLSEGVVLGEESPSFLSGVSIAPNPTEDDLFIRMDLSTQVDLNITLLDMFGKEIRVISDAYVQGNHQVELSMAELPAGIYIINISSGKENYSTKVVKQ